MMKKLVIILACLLPAVAVKAQGRERIYVSTDRSVYITGDEVWCSLFCFADGKLSPFSAVSYLELVSADGTAATAKIGLMEGRGAGKFRIPVSTPTGNYRLIAYTSRDIDYLPGSKIISVFNTNSTSRVKDGVTIVPQEDYKPVTAPEIPSGGVLGITIGRVPHCGQPFTVAISGAGVRADASISVAAIDNIEEPHDNSLKAFLADDSAPAPRRDRLPEYEGEIISAAVEGLDESEQLSLQNIAVATLSSAGSPSDVYVGRIGEKGKVLFFTNNIYGNRELVCQVNRTGKGYISLVDPFLRPSIADIEPLKLSSAQYGALVQRKAAIGSSLQVDTLVSFLPRRQDILIGMLPKTSYHLDDYTRFHSFQEVITEIVGELRLRNSRGQRELQMVIPEGSMKVVKDNILVMLDGVVIPDVAMLEGMDAMLLEEIDLYQETVLLGGMSYNGVANFITRKNYVTALQFPENVRVVDFPGVSYPVAYLGAGVSGKDNRQLLFWHPALEVPADGTVRLQLTAPSNPGTFRITAEGLTSDGEPFREVFYFDVVE